MAAKASCSLVLLKCTACYRRVVCRDFSNNEGKKTKTEDNVNLGDYEGLMSLGVKDVRMSRTDLKQVQYCQMSFNEKYQHSRLIILFLY